MTPAEHDLIPLLAHPFSPHSYAGILAWRILYNAGEVATGIVRADDDYHRTAVQCYGTALNEYLVTIGVWPTNRTPIVDRDGWINLAREVRGHEPSTPADRNVSDVSQGGV